MNIIGLYRGQVSENYRFLSSAFQQTLRGFVKSNVLDGLTVVKLGLHIIDINKFNEPDMVKQKYISTFLKYGW